MASYNYEQYLGQALDSVLAQTYPHFECIVCDDGSTDGSYDVAARYAGYDARIRLIAKSNGGVASALNAAYEQSTGGAICLLDADDFFAPDKLDRIVHGFQDHPEAGLVLHAMQVVDERQQLLYQIPFSTDIEEGWIAEQVVARGGRWRSMPTSALTFRRMVADQLFPIPEEVFRSEADGFLVTLSPLLTPVAFLQDSLAGYRLHGANLTGTTRIDAAVVTRHLDTMERITHAVNERLAEKGSTKTQLSVTSHLNWVEHRFMEALFANRPRRELVRAFVCLAKALLTDDLYTVWRKWVGILANLGAMVLPVQHRAAWLTHVLRSSGWRRTLQALRREATSNKVSAL